MGPDGTSINKVSRSSDWNSTIAQLHELERFQVEPKNGFAHYNQGHDQPTFD